MTRWSRRELLQAGVAAALAAPALGAAQERESLNVLALKKGLRFGTALGGRGLNDAGYVELIRAQCGILVPENELKMPFVQRRPGEFNFERAEKLLQFAESQAMPMRGH